MLTNYIQAAMRHAQCEWLSADGTYYCEIPILSGVWAQHATEEGARAELQDVLEGWIALGLSLGHVIPVVDGIEIVVEQVR